MTTDIPTADATATSVSHSVDVAAPVEHVFDVFTTRMNSWWDPTHHLLADTTEMVVEPFVGGTITDVAADGARCSWGRVLAFEPPAGSGAGLFAFSWDISLRWEIETDPARCSEVHVRFSPTSPTTTRVVLEHRHLDRHGEGWESMRAAVGGPNGWTLGLSRFAEVGAASPEGSRG
ncbi:SRPBCC family protein [Pseudofrankia inefficax]|uniref:Activator of Hsp90 ATPase 1 family protein n=1 Tax=Pseudofrankia inefficax (strain DSM 45817 / CECT 9037 / DDB 130130 / EuI1c) TaxID=298654 RepID=E3JBP6_PSEI1|nr:SRPBCC family protein [Pseudofrankia inefficax]ADP81066.1 Activator of Hsp90 ATPase 1 family protein [Pseudofrankia inefficax]